MVIGQYIDCYYPVLDGVVTTVRNYAYWLNERHCRCFVATPDTPKFIYDPAFPVLRFRSVPVPGRHPYRTGIPRLDGRFRALQSRQAADLVHAHSPFSAGREALRLARRRGIPAVATFHSKYYDDFLQATKSEFIAKQMLGSVVRFYQSADAVWTVNDGTARTLRDYGYRGEIEIMQNGVDFSAFPESDASARERFRERFALPGDVPIFLFVGQQIWQKNLKTLLEATALYKKAGAAFRLLIIGTGSAAADIRRLADDLGLRDTVVFTGPIPDRALLAQAYRSASLFLFPSEYDNAPVVTREAAFFGVPPVLIKGANAAEGVTHGENGYLCENTPEDFCRQVREAMADDAARRLVGERARQTLPVSWESIVARVYERYQAIIAAHRSRGARG